MLALTRVRPGGVSRAICLMLAGLALAGCGINTIPTLDERAKAAWSEVLNQYQRRADLIPNLVETVKCYASHEKKRGFKCQIMIPRSLRRADGHPRWSPHCWSLG